MLRQSLLLIILMLTAARAAAQAPAAAQADAGNRPRIIVSTDIGGTDPDDNQSMAHLLMYSDRFDIEGLISSPSYGEGSVQELLRMIDLYEDDFATLSHHLPTLATPQQLRHVCKQGRRGAAPLSGYDEPTEGSQWIVSRARSADSRPLWILVWGALEDVAQALHDAPDIKSRIRVYWIGGPNKKWGVNAYAYIASHHPDLWMIENNATYRGIITDGSERATDYYDSSISGAGHLGADFADYYGGTVKMGDTPSLLYMMDGDPEQPYKDCWGGRFTPCTRSSRHVYHRQLTAADTIEAYSIAEIWMDGPTTSMNVGTPCLTMTVDNQSWEGYYMGEGRYMVRYCPKAPATLNYTITSSIAQLNAAGVLTVVVGWPGVPNPDDYTLGDHWWTDCPDESLYEGHWQGAAAQRQWRHTVLSDWAVRWSWLKDRQQP